MMSMADRKSLNSSGQWDIWPFRSALIQRLHRPIVRMTLNFSIPYEETKLPANLYIPVARADRLPDRPRQELTDDPDVGRQAAHADEFAEFDKARDGDGRFDPRL